MHFCFPYIWSHFLVSCAVSGVSRWFSRFSYLRLSSRCLIWVFLGLWSPYFIFSSTSDIIDCCVNFASRPMWCFSLPSRVRGLLNTEASMRKFIRHFPPSLLHTQKKKKINDMRQMEVWKPTFLFITQRTQAICAKVFSKELHLFLVFSRRSPKWRLKKKKEKVLTAF